MVTPEVPVPTRTRDPMDQRGFTLIELLIVAVITLLVLGATVTLTSQVESGYSYELEQAAAEQEARYALDWIARLLRQAGTNSYNIIISAANPTPGCLPAGLPIGVFVPVVRDPNGTGVNNNIRILADVNPANRLIGGTGVGNCTERGEDLTVAHNVAARTITLRDNTLGAAVPQTDTIVTDLRFEYLNAARAATTDMRQVAWVRVEVATQARARHGPTGGQPVYRLATEVRLRAR
jgi:prepilin-type N-terminal cleavage/methylation domain-containing protein